jgi:hypothetical protein
MREALRGSTPLAKPKCYHGGVAGLSTIRIIRAVSWGLSGLSWLELRGLVARWWVPGSVPIEVAQRGRRVDTMDAYRRLINRDLWATHH